MKKIYSLVFAVAFSSLAIAQTQKTVKAELMSPKKQFGYNKSALRTLNNQHTSANAKTATGNSAWFNYGTSIESLFSLTSDLSSNYLFPDSAGLGEFGAGNFQGCWIHHLAEQVDFGSVIFSGDPATSFVGASPSTPIYVDSMSIVYAYSRQLANTVVDTLVVTVYDGTKTAGTVFATSGFVSTNYPGGADTVSFRRIGYNQVTNTIAAQTNTATAIPGKMVFKIPLTIADTANTVFAEKVFKLPTAFATTGNRLTVGSVMFKPGYSYVLGDHVDDKNAFFFASLEEQGTNTFMNYFDCNYGSALCDYSQSHILPQDVRYNNAATWNGRFIPALAYTQGYAFEHHLISFHVVDDMPTGINTVADQTGFSLGQNIPNPFTKESVVKYNLAKDVSSAVFTVTDVMGRVISSEKVGTTTGAHSVKLGAYAAGLYYYSLNVDGNVTTKKMIVE